MTRPPAWGSAAPLVVAAVAAELGDLPGEPLGIGLVAATASMARLLVERRPEAVVLVGSAGVYPGGDADLPIGAVVQGRRLGLGAVAVAAGLGYQPGAPPVLQGLDLGLPAADVLTTLAVTSDPPLASQLGVDWRVEHMETYGAAWACHAAGVPFGVVLGVSNRVGPDAHAEWIVYRTGAEAAARAAVARLLRGG